MSRIFILGNGSSLNKTPLRLLENEKTMGVNKIGKIFSPSYYVKIDYSQFDGDNWKDEVLPMLDRPCLLWDVFRDGVQEYGKPFYDSIPEGIGEQINATWVSRCEHHGNKGYQGRWHEPFCTANNSIVTMVQWAEKLGYDEIYLVGCDGEFTDGVTDHFMPYYKSVDSGYAERNNSCINNAHKIIKESCSAPIYNATIGGSIEVYPRVNIYELLK